MPKKSVGTGTKDSSNFELEGLRKQIKDLQSEIAKLKNRGDHEIIVDGEHYHINYNAMLDYFDRAASGSMRQNQFMGPQGSWQALAKILGLIKDDTDSEQYHAGNEKARQLLLKYRGAN